jgi:phosphatidylglycerol---prolipoprotein diacylglyceryl transferase
MDDPKSLFFRGDAARGFVIQNYISHSQLIALCLTVIVAIAFRRWSQVESARLH